MIRQDFNPLPPRMYMEQVMDSVSKAYCFLWDMKTEDNIVDIKWKEICKFYSKKTFRTNIRKLTSQGLLSYNENREGMLIELVGWDEEED